MKNGRLGFVILSPLLMLTCAGSSAVEVKLTATEAAKVGRTPAVITTGVPFARGAVKDVAKLAVSVGGKGVPAQFGVLAPWDDGSVRWALMDVQAEVPAGGKTELTVSDAGGNPAPAAPVKVEDGPEAVKVSTGSLQFAINKKKFNLFESIKVDGKELVTAAGRGLVLIQEGGGEVLAGAPTEVKIEQAGPLRAVVCLRGTYPGIHNDLIGYTVRVTALAGQKQVKVHVWIENQGAMGYWAGDDSGFSKNVEWFFFDGMAVELGLGLGDAVTAACEDAAGSGSLKVLQVCRRTRSLEKNFRGPFYTWADFEYTVTSQGKEIKKGDRTDGAVALKGSAGTLTAAVRDFWQNYEKAVEFDGKALRLWLWPTEGQWPRAGIRYAYQNVYDKNLVELQKDGGYYLQGGVHKGHEFVLDFSGRDPKETAAELSAPVRALASDEYYASTEAAPGLFAPCATKTGDKDCDTKLDAWMRMTRSVADPESATSIFKARQDCNESLPWFGWMDFGDLLVPGSGPASLHYDWLWIMLIDGMRTGSPNAMGLAEAMARHRIDVDQHWSDRDPPEFCGLQRGGYNFSHYHCYRLYRPPGVSSDWLAGVVLYYMLTGEPKALECCRRNAEALKKGWARILETRPYAGPQGDMAVNGWSMASYGAMYGLTADKKWLEEATGLFHTNVVAKWKALGPFLHDGAGQIASQDYIKDDIRYCYSLQSLCELHHLTGDEKMMELLLAGCQKEFPPSFFDAPFFLSTLYAYVGHKTGNAEYVKRAAELFAEGFPESKSPPVYLPDNSTWTRQAGMMLRTGHILQYANWKKK